MKSAKKYRSTVYIAASLTLTLFLGGCALFADNSSKDLITSIVPSSTNEVVEGATNIDENNRIGLIEKRLYDLEQLDAYKIVDDIIQKENELYKSTESMLTRMAQQVTIFSIAVGFIALFYPIIAFISDKSRVTALNQKLEDETKNFKASINALSERLTNIQLGVRTFENISFIPSVDISQILKSIAENEAYVNSETDIRKTKQACITLAKNYLDIDQWMQAGQYLDYKTKNSTGIDSCLVSNEDEYINALSRYLSYSNNATYKNYQYLRIRTILINTVKKVLSSDLDDQIKKKAQAIQFITFSFLEDIAPTDICNINPYSDKYDEKNERDITSIACMLLYHLLSGDLASYLSEVHLTKHQKEQVIKHLYTFRETERYKRLIISLDEGTNI